MKSGGQFNYSSLTKKTPKFWKSTLENPVPISSVMKHQALVEGPDKPSDESKQGQVHETPSGNYSRLERDHRMVWRKASCLLRQRTSN